MKRRIVSHPRSLRGATLIVALVLLIVVTLLGVASLRGVILQEKMAANQYDRNLAFQAAEAALRAGEAAALAQAQAATPNAGFPSHKYPDDDPDPNACNLQPCVAGTGLCGMPDPMCEAPWDQQPAANWATVSGSLGSLAGTPRYLVEYMGIGFPCNPGNPYTAMTCKLYRVTAKSAPGTDRAEVTLQSMFTAP